MKLGSYGRVQQKHTHSSPCTHTHIYMHVHYTRPLHMYVCILHEPCAFLPRFHRWEYSGFGKEQVGRILCSQTCAVYRMCIQETHTIAYNMHVKSYAPLKPTSAQFFCSYYSAFKIIHLPLSLSLSPSYTHTHTLFHTLTHTHTHTHTTTLSHTLTHPHTLTLTPAHTHSKRAF